MKGPREPMPTKVFYNDLSTSVQLRHCSIVTYRLASVATEGYWVQLVLSKNLGSNLWDGVRSDTTEPVVWKPLANEEGVHGRLIWYSGITFVWEKLAG